MSDEVLTRQEISNLLRKSRQIDMETALTGEERDMLGEVSNISMATAATALSQILSKKVEITAPQVTLTTMSEIQEAMTIPNIILKVKFTSGLDGSNLLLMDVPDAAIIASLMLGGDGMNPVSELSELEISAVSEAMNQMIGSASTSIATMLNRNIDITPPGIQIWRGSEVIEIDGIEPEQPIVKVAFRMTVNQLIDSHIMQVFNLDTVKDIANTLLGGHMGTYDSYISSETTHTTGYIPEQPVVIQKPRFGELQNKPTKEKLNNMDLIMDVPLEFSVMLGKTKKTVREVLSLNPGSIVELNKLADEPLEIYVNGKLLAQGEVVVINENFGIRITNIISASERVKNLK